MKTLNAIATSDWHLSGGLKRFFPVDADKKQFTEVNKIAAHAMESGIRHIFINGDISDKPRLDESTLIELVKFFAAHPGLTFYYILGNHDFAQVGRTAIDVLEVFTQIGALQNLKIYRTPTIEKIDGVNVAFVPFPYHEAPAHKGPLLIMAHAEKKGAIGDYGQPLKSESLWLKYEAQDFVFSGHIHTRQQVGKNFVFNGAPYAKTFGEPAEKGFAVFEARSGSRMHVKYEFVDTLPEFRLEQVLIDTNEGWATLEAGDHVFYKVRVAQGIIPPKDITRKFPNIVYLNGASYKGRSQVDPTEKHDSKDVAHISPLSGLRTQLKRYLEHKSEISEAYKLAQRAAKELGIAA